MKTIIFHVNHFSIRGSEVAIYDYADYNEKILCNKSIITVQKNFRQSRDYLGIEIHNEEIYQRFLTRFNIIEYERFSELEEILPKVNADIFYILKSGENDGRVLKNIKTIVHCVFLWNLKNKHGNIYVPISPSIVEESLKKSVPYIPHIVEGPKSDKNLRQQLGIPEDAIVFGRHGGETTFDLPFVHQVVDKLTDMDDKIYFIFVNTKPFCNSKKNLLYTEAITNLELKSQFINTCDAMLHARKDGESFGLAIAEFSVHNKPIITWKHKDDTHGIKIDMEHTFHHEILGETGLYYSNAEELFFLLKNFKSITKKVCPNYAIFSPKNVMQLFEQLIIKNLFPENVEVKCQRYLQLMPDKENNIAIIGDKSEEELRSLSNFMSKDKKILLVKTVKNYDNETQELDLDEIIDIQKIQKIGLIVICDKENYINVLKGCILSINKFRPLIVMELGNKSFNDRESDILHLLSIFNYSSNYIDEKTFICFPTELCLDILKSKAQVLEPIKEESDENKQENLIKVKLMCNFMSNKELCNIWNKMSKGNGRWNSIQIIDKDDNPDYYVIVNKPLDGEKYIPEKTMVFRMEPDTATSTRWNDWFNSKDEFMYFLDLDKYRNNTEWHLSENYNMLKTMSIKKTQCMSTIMSSLYFMEGHKYRIDFLKYIQNKNPNIIDVYGRDNNLSLLNYKGPLPYHNKGIGMFPYKYHFMFENCKMKNYVTEKLLDAILSECVCFYWGCENVSSFFDQRAFIELDPTDFEKSYQIMSLAINNNEWEKRLPYIKKQKQKILDHYSFFPRIEGLILSSKLNTFVVNLDRRKDRWRSFISNAKNQDLKNIVRFSAIDGNTLKMSNDLIEKFKGPTWRPKKGEIGCFLSHMKIWDQCDEDLLVLEDDATLLGNFNDNLAIVYRHAKSNHPDFDIIFIGYHYNMDILTEKNIDINEFVKDNETRIILSMEEVFSTGSKNHPFGYHGGGTFGYIISEKGAKKLKELSSGNCIWPVDYFMLLHCHQGKLNAFTSVKRIVESEMFEKGKKVDSDIQSTKYIKEDDDDIEILTTAKYYSQCGEDKFINEQIFKAMTNGVLVDIGAHDGKTISNTYFFEKEANWTGICVEANPIVYEKLRNTRNTSVNCAITDKDGEEKFLIIQGYPEMLSGLLDRYDPRHLSRIENEMKYGGKAGLITTKTKTLQTLLEEFNLTHVNYLSIDISSSAYGIINTINFDKYFIDVISLENHYDTTIKCVEHLLSKGYKICNSPSSDVILIHQQSAWAHEKLFN